MIKVNGKDHAWRDGMTVADLIKDLNDPYSHAYAVVRINDRLVSAPDFEKNLIPDDSEVFLIPIIAGG